MMAKTEKVNLVTNDIDLTIWEMLREAGLLPIRFSFSEIEIEIEVIDDE